METPKSYFSKHRKELSLILSIESDIQSEKYDEAWEKLKGIAQNINTTNPKFLENPIFREFLRLLDGVRDKTFDGDDEGSYVCTQPLKNMDITFADVAGLEETKNDLKLGFIYPTIYKNLFPFPSKAILLYGPPGAGKTALVKASVAELGGVLFYAPNPGDLRGKFEGETEKNIQRIFKCAASQARSESKKAIIFFDEFDSIGGRRTSESMVRTVNTLLQLMDGVVSSESISIIAATNYPWNLDSAILRRFSSRILVDLPDDKAIEYIIRYSLAKAYGGVYDISPRNQIYMPSSSDEEPEFNLNAPYVKLITSLGSVKGNMTTPGLVRNSVIPINNINSLIKEWVKELRMTEKGKAIIDYVKKSKPSQLPSIPEGSIFGYSPSDITKLMEMMVTISATKSLMGGYAREKVLEDGRKIYVYDPSSHPSNDSKVIEIASAPIDVRNLIYNFNISGDDFKEAKTKFSSTINPSDYISLVMYKSYEWTPKE